ncbi:MAG: NIPSNAP family protein [Rubrivivax sp.]|nr:NIPSNAP family protein [Rubrivivax sp.]
MIFSIRQVSIMPGQAAAARAFAAEITEYVKGAHKLEFQMVRPVGGNPMRLGWLGRYTDLAAFEDAMNKLVADKRFAELNAKTAGLWVPGSMHDDIWQG